jgi:hypothetical protein
MFPPNRVAINNDTHVRTTQRKNLHDQPDLSQLAANSPNTGNAIADWL